MNIKRRDWTRTVGQSPSGGLNARGRASAKLDGMTLRPPIRSGNHPRRASFLARFSGIDAPMRDAMGKPTRYALALKAWGATSAADARRKADAIYKAIKRSVT